MAYRLRSSWSRNVVDRTVHLTSSVHHPPGKSAHSRGHLEPHALSGRRGLHTPLLGKGVHNAETAAADRCRGRWNLGWPKRLMVLDPHANAFRCETRRQRELRGRVKYGVARQLRLEEHGNVAHRPIHVAAQELLQLTTRPSDRLVGAAGRTLEPSMSRPSPIPSQTSIHAALPNRPFGRRRHRGPGQRSVNTRTVPLHPPRDTLFLPGAVTGRTATQRGRIGATGSRTDAPYTRSMWQWARTRRASPTQVSSAAQAASRGDANPRAGPARQAGHEQSAAQRPSTVVRHRRMTVVDDRDPDWCGGYQSPSAVGHQPGGMP